MSRAKIQSSATPTIWPIIIVLVGVLLLLHNFFLLEKINIRTLWPLLLVFLGVHILLRGDILPSTAFRSFGITRGSIESATLEINSGEIDVSISALQSANRERLIAGQYAHNSRPELEVSDVHADLLLQRGKTPWLSLTNWELGISQHLPWQIVLSSYLGQVVVDLSEIILHNALIHTGIGDIHLTVPNEAFEAIYVRSILGTITIASPNGSNVRITVESGRFFSAIVDSERYEEIEPNVYQTHDLDDSMPIIEVIVAGTFGDAYLI